MAAQEPASPKAAATSPPPNTLAATTDTFELLQNRVTKRLEGSGDVLKALDPAAWIGIFSSLVEIIKECRKLHGDANTKASLKSPNMVQKMRLRRALIKHVGRKQMKAFDQPVTQALLATGAEASADEIDAFYTQVKQA